MTSRTAATVLHTALRRLPQHKRPTLLLRHRCRRRTPSATAPAAAVLLPPRTSDASSAHPSSPSPSRGPSASLVVVPARSGGSAIGFEKPNVIVVDEEGAAPVPSPGPSPDLRSTRGPSSTSVRAMCDSRSPANPRRDRLPRILQTKQQQQLLQQANYSRTMRGCAQEQQQQQQQQRTDPARFTTRWQRRWWDAARRAAEGGARAGCSNARRCGSSCECARYSAYASKAARAALVPGA